MQSEVQRTPAWPEEFRYFDRVDRPEQRALRAAVRALTGIELAPSRTHAETFASMYFDADPLAEDFVRDVYLARGHEAGRAMLDEALRVGAENVPGAPPSLLALFADLDRDPDWVDRALVEEGARVFRRYGPELFRLAGTVTLEAYSESSVAKPLALSGAYGGASAKHRFLDTIAFWIAVAEPGGMSRGAKGREAALRVRIMHVFVRARLRTHREWDVARWGVPISQADALLTLMGGSFVPGLAMRALGHRPSKRDIEASMHFWRYVGHVMGVRPRWYPASLEEAAQVLYVGLLRSAGRAGDDGKMLCRSYADAFAPRPEDPPLTRLRDALSHRVHLGYTRFFLSSASYRRNALPAAGPWVLLPLAQFPFVFAAETLRRTVPGLDDVADRVARARSRRFYARHSRGKKAQFDAPARFTR